MTRQLKNLFTKIRQGLYKKINNTRSDCGRCGVCKHACLILGESKKTARAREE